MGSIRTWPRARPPNPVRPSREDDPDVAGMLVFYGSRLEAVKKVVRFDWGVAEISRGIVSRHGDALYVAGRCTAEFRTATRTILNPQPPPGDKRIGPYRYGGVSSPGDVYVAKLPASGDGVLWAVVFDGMRTPPDRLWLDYQGNVYADVHGLVRITPDGRRVNRLDVLSGSGDSPGERRNLSSMGTAHYLSVDPRNGGFFFFGGDRNANTGFQPLRQPQPVPLRRRRPALWNCGLAAPTCARGATATVSVPIPARGRWNVAPDGTLVVAGWSDGGNSVLHRRSSIRPRPPRSNPRLWHGFLGDEGAGSIAYRAED